MSTTQVVLLERVEKLGQMGEIVNVKPGYARNFLLPQKKALRASKANITFYEAQKKTLEAANDKARAEAEKLAKKIEGVKVPIIRQASEAGQLFGSVNSRDIAEAVSEGTKEAITRAQVNLNQNLKMIGLLPIEIILHPEVKVSVTVNIARSPEEAKIQSDTGRALVADRAREEEQEAAQDALEVAAEEVFEEGAELVAEDAAEEKKAAEE